MDNKEAIKIINQYDMNFHWNDGEPIPAEQLVEAFDLAIAALEQQEKAFDEWCTDCKEYDKDRHCCHRFTKVIRQAVEEYRREWPDSKWIPATERLPEKAGRIEQLPSAQPEQRYTEEELRVFQHGISLSLLSKRSSQHWQYDEDTATEIKFLERLYEKVVADIYER